MNGPRQLFVVVAHRVDGRWVGAVLNQPGLTLQPSPSMDVFPSIARQSICSALHLDVGNVDVLVSTTSDEIARWLGEGDVPSHQWQPGELRSLRRWRPDSRTELAS